MSESLINFERHADHERINQEAAESRAGQLLGLLKDMQLEQKYSDKDLEKFASELWVTRK